MVALLPWQVLDIEPLVIDPCNLLFNVTKIRRLGLSQTVLVLSQDV